MNIDDLLNELEDVCGDLNGKGSTKPQTSTLNTKQKDQQQTSSSTTSYSGNYNNDNNKQSTSYSYGNKDDDFFNQSSSYGQQQIKNESKPENTYNIKQNRGGGDVDDLLDLLESEDFGISKPQNNQKVNMTNQKQSSNQYQSEQDKPKQTAGLKQTKCLNPYLWYGGQEYANDEYNMKKRVCNALRCNLCNIQITKLVSYKWDDDVDLLFFRNNFSRQEKLLTKAIKDSSYSAYSCQCKGTSVNKLGTVTDYDMKEWRCTGHYD